MNAVSEATLSRLQNAAYSVSPGWPHQRSHRQGEESRVHQAAPPPQGHQLASARRDEEVYITRWRRDAAPSAAGPTVQESHAILSIASSATDATIRIDDVVVHEGRLSAGTFQLLMPGQTFQATFRKPADFIRFYIPQALFSSEEAPGADPPGQPTSAGRPLHDPMIEQLALAIVAAGIEDRPANKVLLDAIGTALLARAQGVLLAGAGAGSAGSELISWRFKRVADFIDARLDQPLSLGDLARAAGLSRMHFAAQFRLATGFTPHVYLTRRRIERARDLLRHTSMPLVEVALSVGFQSQAHFTTIFRQLSGEPPGRWRERDAARNDKRLPDAASCAAIRSADWMGCGVCPGLPKSVPGSVDTRVVRAAAQRGDDVFGNAAACLWSKGQRDHG